MRICIDCNHLYDRNTAPGQRCPTCQKRHDDKRGTTTQRGYGAAHQAARNRYLANWQPGQPCAIGGEPLTQPPHQLDLAHNENRTGYLGLACQAHNRNTSR